MRFRLFFLAAFLACAASAETLTWIGAADGRWSNPANWLPARVPADGDTLSFHTNARIRNVDNDLPARLVFQSLAFDNVYDVTGNAIATRHGIAGLARVHPEVTIHGPSRLEGEFLGRIDVNGQEVTAGQATFGGPFDGTGTLSCSSCRVAGGDFRGQISGTVTLAGPLPGADFVDGTLRGEGVIGSIRGTVEPGGVVRSRDLDLRGARMDVSAGRLEVTGTVRVAGLLVLIAGDPPIAPGDRITIIDNDGTDAVIGRFAAPATDDGLFSVTAGFHYRIDYDGGDGNDVVLTVTAIPRTWLGTASGRWSDPANWLPAGVPGAGEPLLFPARAARYEMTNDLPPTLLGPVDSRGDYSIDGNTLVLGGDWTALAGSMTFRAPVAVAARQTWTSAAGFVLEGAVTIEGHTLTLSRSGFRFDGPVNGSGNIGVQTSAHFGGGGSLVGGIEGRLGAAVTVEGDFPNTTVFVRQLTATGTLGEVRVGRILRLDGLLRTKSLSFPGVSNPASREPARGELHVEINADGTHGRIAVTGTVTTSVYTVLNITRTGGLGPPGRTYTIIDNDGDDPLPFLFVAMPEGTVAGNLRLSYRGGDGNDLTLTELTPPAVVLTKDKDTTLTGEPLTLTADVRGSSGTPTGTVAFFLRLNGDLPLGTAPLIDGVATLATSIPYAGTRDLIARYHGDATYGSSERRIEHVVEKGATTIYVAPPRHPFPAGSPVVLDVIVYPVAPAGGWPTGNLTVRFGDRTITTTLIDSRRALSIEGLPAGITEIAIEYSGNDHFAGSSATYRVEAGQTPARRRAVAAGR